MKRNNGSAFGFNDLLFQVLLGYTVLFFLSFILINDPVKKETNIQSKTEYLFTLEWDVESSDDVDLWVQDPTESITSFQRVRNGFITLDRDDLGMTNDIIELRNGDRIVNKTNREVVSVRAKIPGWYIVNIHMYRKEMAAPANAHVEIIQVQPYRMIYQKDIILKKTGEEHTIIRFKIDETGQVLDRNFLFKNLFTGVGDLGDPR